MGGQITILAVYHNMPELNMTSVMYNSVKINGSCMFTPCDILEAIEIISKDASIASHMISHEIPFEDRNIPYPREECSDTDRTLCTAPLLHSGCSVSCYSYSY